MTIVIIFKKQETNSTTISWIRAKVLQFYGVLCSELEVQGQRGEEAQM